MDKIVYPVAVMHTTAQQIRTNALSSLSTHEQKWQLVQHCLLPLPGFLSSAVNALLEPHDQRLRASYQWQMDLATRLDQAASAMAEADQRGGQSF
jgi:hypothetical protein